MQEVTYYSGAKDELNLGKWHWVKEKPPKDAPVCGWDHSKCPDEGIGNSISIDCKVSLSGSMHFGGGWDTGWISYSG